MSSVSSLSSTSSLYGNRNVLSGLASGLDTESMIENMVSGTKAKITSLQQKRTTWEWKQEAYRNIIDLMVDFTQKYTSYTSSTNLLSSSFFTKAVTTIANGANAEKVSATGKSSSEVQINGVKQLATAAKYVSGASNLAQGQDGWITADNALNLGADMELSKVSGSLTFTRGNKTVTIDFDETEVYKSAEELAQAIEKKLGEQKLTTADGDSKPASDLIKVDWKDGQITFTDKTSNNSVFISSASGDIKTTLGIQPGDDAKSIDVGDKALYESQGTVGEYLSGKTIDITLDGVKKSITLPEYEKGTTTNTGYAEALNEAIADKFGAGKVEVKLSDDGKLQFKAQANSTLQISSSVGDKLGIEGSSLTNYVDTSKNLGKFATFGTTQVDGQDVETMTINGVTLTGKLLMGEGDPIEQKDGTYLDRNGNKVDENGVRLGEDGKALYGYDLTINGKTVGTYTRDTALETVMLDVNNDTEAGVNVSYSKVTNQFVFTAEETGASGKVEFGGDLAKALFVGEKDNGKMEEGKDAILTMTVNGSAVEVTRSSNTFDVDGMSVTLKGTFGYEGDNLVQDTEAVSFTTTSDADTIVDAIKGMVEDYNKMAKAIKDAYGTMPAQRSNGGSYEPLTDEDMADMSDEAIKNYEEKAKQGLLFADSDLSSLYSGLLSAITPSGTDGATLRSIGINTSYDDGMTTLTLDESKLREALSSNPDKVKDAFTKSQENGSATDGLMTRLKTTLDRYASTTGATKGILIEKAGSSRAPTSILDNYIQDMMDNIDDQIERWETKLSDQVDRYTSQFTQLEVLIQQMNSQSASLSGLMGGYQ